MSVDDLEPIDVEPVDLEPVDLEPIDLDSDDESAPEPASSRFRWAPLALIAAVAVAWAGIAMLPDNEEADEATTLTLPAATPTTGWIGFSPQATETPSDRTVAVLLDALYDVGTGRFAAVIDDRFYVLDAGSQTARRVDTLGQFAAVETRSGRSLLVRTRSGYVLFDTERDFVTDLGSYRLALPAVERDRWWLVDHDGLLRDSAFGRTRSIPDGLRLVGEYGPGFLGITVDGYALWDGNSATAERLTLDGSVLSVTGDAIVTRSNCTTATCEISVTSAWSDAEPDTRFTVAEVIDGAMLSPSGMRLAVSTTRGEVAVVERSSGSVWFRANGTSTGGPASAFSWTTTSDELLVVEENDLEIWGGPGTVPRTIVGVPGLTQIVGLP